MNCLEHVWPEFADDPDTILNKTITINCGGSQYVFLVHRTVTEQEFYDHVDTFIDESFGRSLWFGIVAVTEVSTEIYNEYQEVFRETNQLVEGV